MNPWKIIGLIVLSLLALGVYWFFRGDSEGNAADQTRRDEIVAASRARVEAARGTDSPFELTVNAFSCEKTAIFPVEMNIQVQNTGPKVEFAKLFATIGGNPEDAYLSPMEIPAGAFAEATIVSQSAGECRLVGIQGRNGEPIRVVMNVPE